MWVTIMKKIKELIQMDLENIFTKKIIYDDNEQNIEESEDCKNCDNVGCKCNQIMDHLAKCIELSDQIGHTEVYNILLTVFVVLQNLSSHEHELEQIMNICQKVFTELSPKEMEQILH